jgi:hypothetical protein
LNDRDRRSLQGAALMLFTLFGLPLLLGSAVVLVAAILRIS